MSGTSKSISARLDPIIRKYKDQCLWFLREDVKAETVDEALRILDLIERYGDTSAFIEVRREKKWLLRNFKEKSAD